MGIRSQEITHTRMSEEQAGMRVFPAQVTDVRRSSERYKPGGLTKEMPGPYCGLTLVLADTLSTQEPYCRRDLEMLLRSKASLNIA